MHTCLIISLHGVVVFFVIIECADKYMCRCNNGENSKPPIQANDVYLDWIGHFPCNDGYVFAMLNVRLQNRANLATMVTYCDAACIGRF